MIFFFHTKSNKIIERKWNKNWNKKFDIIKKIAIKIFSFFLTISCFWKEQVMKDFKKESFLSTEQIIIGFLLGVFMTFWAGKALIEGVSLTGSPVMETLIVAVYLTMLLAYAQVKIPVFFTERPRVSTFILIVFCGHISLFFDSFAVVLLLSTGIVFLPIQGEKNTFNQFVVKTFCAFAALTVGGGFYLGELWGLPWFISNGLNNPIAGFPILLVLTPYCIFLGILAAIFTPVRMEKVTFTKQQTKGIIEFTIGLLLIVITHSAFLCIGILLIYAALSRKTMFLIEVFVHELKDGALNAIGLILIACVIINAGLVQYIQPHLDGVGLFIAAAISSPFAGAIAAPVNNLHDFYVGLSMLMVGAPMFVFSSLVAIVVFKNHILYKDIPRPIVKICNTVGLKQEGVNEAILYSIIIFPLNSVLALLLYAANTSGLIVYVAEAIGVKM